MTLGGGVLAAAAVAAAGGGAVRCARLASIIFCLLSALQVRAQKSEQKSSVIPVPSHPLAITF